MSKSGRSVEEIYKLSRNSELPSSSLMPVTTGYTDLAQVVTSTSKLKMESVYGKRFPQTQSNNIIGIL